MTRSAQFGFQYAVLALALIPAFILGAGPALAQVPGAQTSTADPGRVEEQIKARDFQRTTDVPGVGVREAPVLNAPAGADKINFVLNSLRIDGVTAYGDDDLRGVYAGSIGQSITLADLYGIANALTRKFRNEGYILTQVVVPPQTIDGGNVRLQVVEGYISSVNVTLEDGARAETERSMRLINKYADRITTGRALNVKDLERYMLLINDLPGVTARGVLAPASESGAADLNILVQRDTFDALIGFDNYGTRYLGPIQLSGAASANSLFNNNERLTAQSVIAPEPGEGIELGYFALGYTQPLMDNGLKLDIATNYTATEPGFDLDRFDVQGISKFAAVTLSYPVIRTRATSLYSTFSFDARNVDTRNNLEATREDRIRALRAGARLEHLDTLFGAGLNIADLELSQGLDIMGASSKQNQNKSRAEGEGEFTKLNIELQRLQRLTQRFNLLFGVRGQLSNDALLSSEEFGVGGLGYGRGYDPSEIIGDEGIAAKLELQWNVPGPFAFTHDNQLFGFYDAGRIWNDDPATLDLKTETARSAGLGVRSKIMDYTNMDMTLAFPLDRNIQTQRDDDPRFYFSLSRKF